MQKSNTKVQVKMEPSTSTSQEGKSIHILTLNQDVIQAILSHLNYDEVAKLRMVRINFPLLFDQLFLYNRKNNLFFSFNLRYADILTKPVKRFSTKVSWLFSATTIVVSKKWRPSCHEESLKGEPTR